MKFLKKEDAINYYNKTNNSNLKLFCKDTSRVGGKEFIVTKPNLIYNCMKKECVSNYYEFWTEKSKLYFSLDIDMKIKGDCDYKVKITELINNVILGAKKFYDYDYKIADIIVLQNDVDTQKVENPNKISFHVIFRGLVFENNLVCKDFFMRLNKEYNMEHADKAIYGLTCFRLCFNAKLGKRSILMPVEYTINKQQTLCISNDRNTDDDIKDFWLKTFITNIDKCNKLITKSDIKTSMNILKPNILDQSGSNVNNINLESIIFQLPLKYCDDYDTWCKMGMILFNISDGKNDYYDLWDRWSQQSDKYKSKEMLSKWNSFKSASLRKPITLGTLIHWCKQEGIDNIYKNDKRQPDKIVSDYPIRETIVSECYMKNALILNQEKLTSDIFTPILNTSLLAVQSEKGTGKTQNLLESLFKNNLINKNTSVLFVSSRRTFGIKLFSDLKEQGFKLYSDIKDPYITSKKVICQIDSLLRLERDTYDYVIVDECESLARYLTSSHFVKNPKANIIVSTLDMRIRDAKHVYIMDADLSDRCLNYYTKLREIEPNNVKVIINTYKPYSVYDVHYMSYGAWLNQIIKDIDSDKKLVIPMASNNKAKDLKKMIELKFQDKEKKVLLIHKETSDEEKVQKMLKVNEEWVKYDVVIYTPSVCMGVSFDVLNHFDNIYGYGCFDSLGSQEFCQMLHRVRNPINKKIYLSLDMYKEYTDEDSIEYDIVEKMLCSDYYLTSYNLHNNLVQKKVIKTLSTKSLGLDDNIDTPIIEALDKNINTYNNNRDIIMSYPYKDEPIYDLYVRNCWESIEDKINFSRQLFGYIKYKGYNIKYIANDQNGIGDILKEMKNIRAEREDEDTEKLVNGVFEAPILNEDEYNNKIRQRDEYINDDDINAIKKYNLIKCFGINDEIKPIDEIITKPFIETFCNKDKMCWFRNLTTILNTNEQTTEQKLEIMKDNAVYNNMFKLTCYSDFTSKNKYAYHFYATKIIKNLHLDLNDLNREISYTQLKMGFDDCSELFDKHKIDMCKTYDMMSYLKKDLNKLDDITDSQSTCTIRFINSILCSQYGVRLRKINNKEEPNERMYKLSTNDIWSDPNKEEDDKKPKKNNIEEHYDIVDPWKKSINLIMKRDDIDKYENYDTSGLDYFEDEFIE
jgi:hypothetical protein